MFNEPVLSEGTFFECKVVNNFEEFKSISDVIVTDRMSDDLQEVEDKVYMRDIFSRIDASFSSVGTLGNSCDYIHNRFSKGHVAAIDQTEKVHIYKLGIGKGTSVMELVRTFGEANGIKIPYEKYARLELLEPHADFIFIKGDISDKTIVTSIFEEYKPNIVVNLAAQAGYCRRN